MKRLALALAVLVAVGCTHKAPEQKAMTEEQFKGKFFAHEQKTVWEVTARSGGYCGGGYYVIGSALTNQADDLDGAIKLMRMFKDARTMTVEKKIVTVYKPKEFQE